MECCCWQTHPHVTSCVPDVSDAASVSAACQLVSTRLGEAGLNLLVNNAAVNRPIPGSLAQTGADDMMDVYRTNVVGPMLLSKVGARPYAPTHCIDTSIH